MNTYTVKGKTLDCVIKANTKAEAVRILSAPLVEVLEALQGVYFERK